VIRSSSTLRVIEWGTKNKSHQLLSFLFPLPHTRELLIHGMDIPELANFTPRQPLASGSSNFPLDPQLLSQGPSTSSSQHNYWDDQDTLDYHEEGEGDYASGSQEEEGESEEETDAEQEFAQSQSQRSKRGRTSQGGLLREDGTVDKGKGKARAVDQDQEEGEDLGSVFSPSLPPSRTREVE